jgi:hypothetical protein
MSKIICHGEIAIPEMIVANAETIKLENYKTNTPKRFQVNRTGEEFFINMFSDAAMMSGLVSKIDVDVRRLDFVYFSVCKGAEPHVDLLDPTVFEPRTFVIPVVLPQGKSVITAEDEEVEVKLNHVYEFNHEKIHSMTLEDNESGCVVIMISVKK